MKKILNIVLACVALCMPTLAQSTNNQEIEIGTVWTKYYPLMGSWSVVLTTAENEDIRYVLDITAPEEMESGKAYACTGGWQNLDSGDYVSVSKGTYTRTTNADQSIDIVADVTLANHEHHIARYHEQGAPTATDTIDVRLEKASLQFASTSLGDPVIVVSGQDADYQVSLSFYGGQVKASYSNEQRYDYFTNLRVKGQQLEVKEVSATAEEHETGFTMDAFVLAEDAHCYHVVLLYELPEPTSTASLSANNMLIDESKINQFGQIVFSASDKQKQKAVELWINTESIAGHYKGRQVDYEFSVVTNLSDENTDKVIYADVEVTQDGNITRLTGKAQTEGGVLYQLALEYVRPEVPTEELTLLIEDASVDMLRLSEEGVLYVRGYDESGIYNMDIMLYISELSGEFTTPQFDPYYTVLTSWDNGMQTDVFDFLEGKVKVTLEDDIVTLQGDIFVQSEEDPSIAPMVHLTMWAYCETGRALDNSESDFWAVLDEVEVTDLWDESGVLVVDAYNRDRTKMAAISFFTTGVDNGMVPVGTYRIESTGLPMTVGIAPETDGGQLYPSFAAMSDERGEPDVPLWYLTEGTVTVGRENGQMTIVVDAKNTFNRHIGVVAGPLKMDTVDVLINDCEIVQYESEFQFMGPNRDYEAYVAIQKNALVGEYTWADANKAYTRVRLKGTEYIDTHDLRAVVSETENGYQMEAWLTRDDAKVMHILFTYYNEPTVSTGRVELKDMHMTWDNVWAELGEWLWEGENEDYELMFTTIGNSVSDIKSVDYKFTQLTDKKTGAFLHFVDYKLTEIEELPEDWICGMEGWILVGYTVELLGKDGLTYRFDIYFQDQTHVDLHDATHIEQPRKMLIGNQIVIRVGNKTYNAAGVRL